MLSRRRALRVLATSATLLSPLTALAGGFVLLRNAANDVGSVTKDELYKWYTGESKQFGAFVAQTVIGPEGSPEFMWLADLFAMRPKDLLTKIKQQVFRGEMRRPIVAKSAEDAIAAVRNNRGGLAIAGADVAAALPPEVVVTALR